MEFVRQRANIIIINREIIKIDFIVEKRTRSKNRRGRPGYANCANKLTIADSGPLVFVRSVNPGLYLGKISRQAYVGRGEGK